MINAIPGPVARVARGNRLIAAALAPIVNRVLPSEPTPVLVRSGPASGMAVVINPREEKFYWAGTHEAGVQRALVRLLGEGATFWDVGAHCGFFTCLASRLVGESGCVVAIEPCEENRARLLESIALNGATNVEVLAVAADASPGAAPMSRVSTSTTWRLTDGDQRGTVAVEAMTLDALTSQHPNPDVIKIDVEGAELRVLKGAGLLLAERRPVLMIEFHSDDLLSAGRELLRNYVLEEIDERQWLAVSESVLAG